MAKKSASPNAQSARQAAGSNHSARGSARKASAPAASGRKNAAHSDRQPAKSAAHAVVDQDTADLVRDMPPSSSGRRDNDAVLAAKAKTAKIGVDTQIINRIVLRAHDLKSAHPQIAAEIDLNEWEIRKCMETIRTAVDQLPEENRELVTVLVINGIHRMCDDILIAPDVKTLADEADESDEP